MDNEKDWLPLDQGSYTTSQIEHWNVDKNCGKLGLLQDIVAVVLGDKRNH